jgi:hypothetical protein
MTISLLRDEATDASTVFIVSGVGRVVVDCLKHSIFGWKPTEICSNI